jgi:hypothetical protein
MPYFDKNPKPTYIPPSDNEPVKVIASFGFDGKYIPAYFEYKGHAVKVDKVQFCKPISMFGTAFYCDVYIYNRSICVVLSFIRDSCKWYLDIR